MWNDLNTLDQTGGQLRELCAKLNRLLAAGEDCTAEALLAAYPAIAADSDSALELIYTEFVVREQLGQFPSPEQWYARFPHLRCDLEQIFQVHRFVCPDSPTATDISDTPLHPGRPAGPRGATDSSTTGRRQFGSYELIEEISRGGMGVVYKARQRGLNRIVALKMILAGEFAGAEELARFRREAEAAASLQHPNIVQIYEVGVHDGVPFFSLEYVDGGNLQQKLANGPLPANQAADLVKTLARAVYHAHQQGIIHRDLKPANILLAVDSRKPTNQEHSTQLLSTDYCLLSTFPKITDFGLAKHIVDATMHETKTGAVLGTPSYMAPEQAEGKNNLIGPAVDIYSLGAILYESLTGRPPFRGSTPLETLEQVRLQDPVSLRRLQPKVPHDLEIICLTCLQKEPSKRYASALGLAEDLERFETGEPIHARSIRSWERALKWAKRRPAVTALLGALVLVGVLGISGVIWQWRLAVKGRADAESALAGKEEQRKIARRAVDKMFTQVAEKWLSQQPRLEPLQRQFLEDALHFYEGFAAEEDTDPEVRLETGNAYRRVGEIQKKLGELAKAEEALNRAIALLEPLVAEFPDEPKNRAALALCRHNRGGLLRKLGRLHDCERELRESLLLREQLVVECPNVPEYAQDLALGYFEASSAQAALGRPRAAENGFNQALAILQKLPAELKNRPECRVCEAVCHEHIGWVQEMDGRSSESVESRKLALVIFEQLVRDYPSDPAYRNHLALALMWLGSHAQKVPPQEAEAALRRALDIGEKLVADFPSVPDYKVHVAIFRKFLAVSLDKAGRADEAKQTFGDALKGYEHLVAEFPGDYEYAVELTNVNFRLMDMLRDAGRFPEAEKACRDALLISRKHVAGFPAVPDYRNYVALGNHLLGEILSEAMRPQEAEAAYREAVAIWSNLVKEFPTVDLFSERLALSYGNLAELFTISAAENFRNPVEAVKCARKAVELRPDILQPWNALGVALYRSGDWNGAVAALDKSVELGKGGFWFDWFFLAMAHWRLDHKEAARKWYEKGVAWMENNKAELATNKPKRDQVGRYRAEAENVLQIRRTGQ
jgi:serine/threonine protein kinase